jgi:hypothetical protein
MNFQIRVQLNTSPEQYARLCELRVAFAQVCNQLAPHVQQSRVWNRVALHHLHYRSLREQFPALGSQMVCNAIYAVSKMARLIYQHPQSPYNPVSRPNGNLPLLRFADNCPVYFDRHTLSLKAGQLSLFTMDGRMRFDLALEADKLAIFEQAKLREIVLNERSGQVFELSFYLDSVDAAESDRPDEAVVADDGERLTAEFVPEYVSVEVAP